MSRSESAPASGDGIAPDRRTLGTAAVGGVLSYLVAYAITYAVTGQQIANSLAARVLEIATGDPGTWKLVGWVFYSAHYVTSEIPGLFGSTAVNLVGRGDTFPAALFLLPPVVLVVAGALVAVVGRSETAVAGAVGGASVTLGYLPLAVAGAFLFSIAVGDSTAGPTLVTAVLLAGLVYPLVFGALGGAVGSFASGSRA
ncbi:transporter [Halobellus litoreus]|uniref:Transporter n=1 Tax=Halobellus litoreus TaxID=755310 RepID=A0ABD6DUS7_9EURY|nr:transporter [Halobellus litoreus]